MAAVFIDAIFQYLLHGWRENNLVATKTTNYLNTFIAVSPDCPATGAEIPPIGAKPTVASLQYALLHELPYQLTSDEILFAVYATRTGIPPNEHLSAWKEFFQKDQACLRASPLPKRYGWGIHHDEEGRVAVVGIDDPQYEDLVSRSDVVQKSALRSSRKN